ncbi:GUN4 domain-containing protein [Gloeothece verrucosa]|uniref:GUN4 domain protein n=1 Tax=Gloeothece verrucosa (strain PCC 7822) TaxID=497965 RepID=E0U9S2_GLOV7|nr:GUN4 domain-containing protein [Gloeothece verrucosa]ADN14992.1 GUN4 domain protein [Gloeothece verrucosa PCC 7822]
MNPEENYILLNQRIAELESQVESLSKLFPLVEKIAQLEKIQESINKIESNFTLIEDIDRYSPLRNLLSVGDFKAADLETTRVLLEIAGEDRQSLTPDDIRKFPCSAIRVIDRLWKIYSDDRFGFSIQLQIYQEIGGTRESLIAQDMGLLIKFGDQVGWRENGEWQGSTYEQWNFSLSAPKGCFPVKWWSSPYGAKMVNFFFVRLLECQV